MDFFKQPIPTVNLNGKVKTSTLYGSLISIAMMVVLLVYADFKMTILVNRHNPLVSFFVEEQVLTSDDQLDLMREGLRFAWTVEGYSDLKRKDDPRYVKLLMRIGGRKNGESIEEIIDFHRCTDEDFEEFAPPSADADRTLKKILKDEDRGLFCIDWEKFGQKMHIFGTSHYTDFRFIDVELVPCQYIHNRYGYEDDKVTPECLYDKEGAEKYLSNLRFWVYISETRFK